MPRRYWDLRGEKKEKKHSAFLRLLREKVPGDWMIWLGLALPAVAIVGAILSGGPLCALFNLVSAASFPLAAASLFFLVRAPFEKSWRPWWPLMVIGLLAGVAVSALTVLLWPLGCELIPGEY